MNIKYIAPVWTPPTWKGMDGATAWHLIDRHADDWSEVGQMMNEWLAANTPSKEALVAELAKGNKPVARICSGWQLLFIGSDSIAEVARKHSLKIGDALYTLPPTAEQIEQETAEAIANFLHQFKRHVGGDGEFWLHELEYFYDAISQGEQK